MKKQYCVSINAGSLVAEFLDGMGHKRGVVIEAVIAQHLREHKGYLSPEAAIEAGYRFSEKDTAFAGKYRSDKGMQNDHSIAVPKEGKDKLPDGRKIEKGADVTKDKSRREWAENEPTSSEVKAVNPAKEKKALPTQPVGENDFPEIKNKDMVLAGLSAFMA